MNKTTKALKLAEEALGELHYSNGTVKAVALLYSALAAIHEALAEQDKQEPVKACVSGVCPNKAKCDAAQFCLYTEAEPVKQEPVAWWFQPPNKNVRPMFDTQQHGGKWKPLYEAPVRTKDLPDDEMNNAYTHGYNKVELAIYLKHEAGLRAVIAADREKNK